MAHPGQSYAGYIGVTWGASYDTPVHGDFDGDGKDDPAVFRPTTGTWYFLKSSDNYASYTSQVWGNWGDQPVPADYDGDGKADLAIWRPTTGHWWIDRSSDTNYETYLLGVPGDIAIPSSFTKQVGGTATADELATARLNPRNATGGTNLYSQNFSWGTTLMSLPGRSGLDASLSIGYNSLVWTKVGSEMYFDADKGNAGPGFRFGLPVIEPIYWNSTTSKWSYMMVSPSGARTEFRETTVSNIYDAADSSYTRLVSSEQSQTPNDPVEEVSITVTTTDGTQMTYVWIAGAYRCTQIKDRNGNYITAAYDFVGRLDDLTDTLGRVIDVKYDGSHDFPTSIQQTWKSNNGGGSDITNPRHAWAIFAYTTKTVAIDFHNDITSIVGPPNDTAVTVLDTITYPDGSVTKFHYNGYVQVWKVESYADNDDKLNYVRTNLASPSSDQTDCPRFVETATWARLFNVDPEDTTPTEAEQEVVVTNSAPQDSTYTVSGGSSQNTSVVQVENTEHPDDLYTLLHFGRSGWSQGLPIATRDCIGSNCSSEKRWTWTNWTQDNTGVSYITNPRVTESQVGDGTNTKKTTISYYQPTTGVFPYGLPETVQVFNGGASTPMKKSVTSYNLSTAYTDRRIIGLPAQVEGWGWNDSTTQLEYVSKVTYTYDGENFGDSSLNQSITPTQHDGTNYSSSFVTGRGNLSKVTRHNIVDSSTIDVLKVKHNTAGSPVARITPWDGTNTRTVTIKYEEASMYNDNVTTRNTHAYPTKIYDPAGNYSSIKYRYDIGANVEATSPAPANQQYGKTTKRIYDGIGRLERDSVYVHTTEQAYTRYDYSVNNGVTSRVLRTLVDVSGSTSGPDTADEVLTETISDGAGRVIQARTEHPGSTGGWSSVLTEYDILGRVFKTSVPTETNSSYTPVGDDATRGFIYNWAYYDWKNRVVRTRPSDSTSDTDGKDTLMSYEGCGCAGGQITTIESPEIAAYGGPYRRKEKIYEDILGRTVKKEVFAGTSVYSTIKTEYNGRDQALNVKHYEGADTSSVLQTTSMTYDGHGRMATKHLPEENSATNTTWAYNLDDTVQTATDPRGVITSFTYNNRALLTGISYTLPQGSTIPATSSVTFAFDNLGNRTSMSDGTGTHTYAYDSLSRLTSETKSFTGVTGSFTIGYTYQIGGGVKSVSDPSDSTRTVDYTYNKGGALTDVSFNSSSLVTNRKLRAFGGVKQEDYGDGYKLRQQFDNKLRISEYEIQNASSQVTTETLYEYNYADQVTRANSGGYFDRSYEYDHVGRMTGAGTAVYGGADYASFGNAMQYDAFDNLTSRQSITWGAMVWGWSTYQNNRNTQANGWNNWSTTTPPTEYWQYDANGNATATGEQTHKFDAADQKVESYETTPWPHYGREALLLQQTYDGDGAVVKRREYEIFNQSSSRDETKYSLLSTVLGGVAVAKVTPTGSRIDETIYRPDGTKVATKNTTVEYNHEAPFIGPGYSDPFGVEIPPTPPLNPTPDWLPVGSYQQAGNGFDPHAGCMENGMSGDCSVIADLCVGNPLCMNEAGGGIGYILYGVFLREFSSQDDKRKTKPKGRKPTLRPAPPRTKAEVEANKAKAATGVFDNEADDKVNVDPPDFRKGLLDGFGQALKLLGLFTKKVNIVGFSDPQREAIEKSLFGMMLSQACADAFKSAGIPTPAEVMRDRGVIIAHYNALTLPLSASLTQLGVPTARIAELRYHANGVLHKKAGGFTANYPDMSPTTVLFDHSFGSSSDFSFEETMPHESIHRSNVPATWAWYQYPLGFLGHDLTGYSNYDSIIAACKPST